MLGCFQGRESEAETTAGNKNRSVHDPSGCAEPKTNFRTEVAWGGAVGGGGGRIFWTQGREGAEKSLAKKKKKKNLWMGGILVYNKGCLLGVLWG